jgi:hypothetical protein
MTDSGSYGLDAQADAVRRSETRAADMDAYDVDPDEANYADLDYIGNPVDRDQGQDQGQDELAEQALTPEQRQVSALEGEKAADQEEEEEENQDRWLQVHSEGSRDGYRDMQRFIGTVSDPGRADRLDIAISGPGAFRRFKDVLARWPGELDRWFAFSAERERGRARAWLAASGYYVRLGIAPAGPDPAPES